MNKVTKIVGVVFVAALAVALATSFFISRAEAQSARFLVEQGSGGKYGAWQVQGIANGVPIPIAPDQTAAAATLSTACATTTACAATASIQMPVTGIQSAETTVTAIAAPVGFTVACDTSFDGGTTYTLTKCSFIRADGANTGVPFQTLANAQVVAGATYQLTWRGSPSHVRVRVSAVTSGTFTASLRGVFIPPPIPPWISTSGTTGTASDPNGGFVGVAVIAGDAANAANGNVLRSSANDTNAISTGLLTQPAVSRATPTATTAGRSEAIEIGTTGSLFTDLEHIAGLAVPANNNTAELPVVGPISDGSAYPVLNRFPVPVGGSDGSTSCAGAPCVKTAQVSPTDTNALGSGIADLPAVARASGTATTAGRAESLQIRTTDGRLFSTDDASSATGSAVPAAAGFIGGGAAGGAGNLTGATVKAGSTAVVATDTALVTQALLNGQVITTNGNGIQAVSLTPFGLSTLETPAAASPIACTAANTAVLSANVRSTAFFQNIGTADICLCYNATTCTATMTSCPGVVLKAASAGGKGDGGSYSIGNQAGKVWSGGVTCGGGANASLAVSAY